MTTAPPPEQQPAASAAGDLTTAARTIAAAVPTWLVWKGGADLAEAGDVDSAAPRGAWPSVARAFDAWADDHGLLATVRCRHVPGQMVLVGCGGTAGGSLIQVDVVAEKIVHGRAAWTAEDLAGSTLPDPVRRTSPGAEGVARVLADRADTTGRALVSSDQVGARALALRLGVRGRLAFRDGRGNRLLLELVLAARAALGPAAVARSASTDRARRRCPVLASLSAGRRAPHDLEAWLERLAADHEVRRRA